ncbi:DUF1232 domain-containing protein [Burkholderiales bacterium]|nr:DUF1232 domain-containing protein [Burkholderiales bacterium]
MLRKLFKKFIADILVDIVTYWLALKARSLGILATVITCLMVSYALSPIDLIPDVIPILGYLDELIIIPILIAIIKATTPHFVTKEYRALAKGYLRTKAKPKFKLGVILVLITWTLFAYAAISALE